MLTSFLLAGAAGAIVTQTELPDAATLLDRREASIGTSAARAARKGIAIQGQVLVHGFDMPCSFEELHLVGPAGERVLATLSMGTYGTTTQGTDGRVSWTTDAGFGIAVEDGPAQMSVRRMWAIVRSEPWRSLYTGAKTLGAVERDGRALFELELAPREGRPERWFLDRETSELVRVAVVYPGPTGGTLPMEWVLTDWRAVDGVLYPHKRVQEIQSGAFPGETEASPPMRIEYVCDSIRHEALEPARVAPPPDVAAAILDPSKRAQKPPADPGECQVETRTSQHVATVRLEIDASKVSETLAGSFAEVVGVLQQQGAEMTGPPFSRYHRIDMEAKRIDIEAGIPVKAPIQAAGRVKPSELPGGKVATTWHVGSYHDLQKSYDRLDAWIRAQAHVSRGGFWEIYWTDPSLEPDPSTWRTQLVWPVE